jgi:hypothetical protein
MDELDAAISAEERALYWKGRLQPHELEVGAEAETNPPEAWIRSEASFAPIVKPALFWQAQKISARRRLLLSDRDLLDRLRALLVEKGELSASIIDASFDLPANGTYIKRFGSLRKAYAAMMGSWTGVEG